MKTNVFSCVSYALWLFLWSLFMIKGLNGSIYRIKSDLWIPPFQRAEKVFATDRGPILSRRGNSSITVNVTGINLTPPMNSWKLVVFFYHATTTEVLQNVQTKIEVLACSQQTGLEFAGMTDVQKFIFPVKNESVEALVKYIVEVSGWIDTQIFVCSEETGTAEVMDFEGTMTIQNMYGYLPAVLYGMLPFSGFLSIGYLVLDVFFVARLIQFRDQIIHLHYGILFVLSMGTLASALGFFAFYSMNITGEPVCCPYPPIFLVAVVFDTLVRTLARVILLVVCMGYGIVRENLSMMEKVVILILSFCYFVSGVGDEASRGTSSGAEFRQRPTAWSFIQLLCNLTFIMWIHYSLEKILKELKDMKQTAKLEMYKLLGFALAGFILFFTVLTFIAVLGRFGAFEWDVEWEWMQQVAWPVLNFIVCGAMCFIWRPTSTSSQFAFSMQLPMSEDSPNIQADNYEDEDEDEEEDVVEIDLPKVPSAVDSRITSSNAVSIEIDSEERNPKDTKIESG